MKNDRNGSVPSLVITRRVGESIRIGNDITVVLDRIESKKKVRLRVAAPMGVEIRRSDGVDHEYHRPGHRQDEAVPHRRA